MVWITFFSQTGGEIQTLSKMLGRYPDLIVTNRNDLTDVKVKHRTMLKLPNKPSVQEYLDILKYYDSENTIITLHGYLRILPAQVCNKYEIYNLHQGLITKYPELKGKDPQEKAYKLKLPTSGAVLHRVTAELDSGPIIDSFEINIQKKSVNEIYNNIYNRSADLWFTCLKRKFNGYET